MNNKLSYSIALIFLIAAGSTGKIHALFGRSSSKTAKTTKSSKTTAKRGLFGGSSKAKTTSKDKKGVKSVSFMDARKGYGNNATHKKQTDNLFAQYKKYIANKQYKEAMNGMLPTDLTKLGNASLLLSKAYKALLKQVKAMVAYRDKIDGSKQKGYLSVSEHATLKREVTAKLKEMNTELQKVKARSKAVDGSLKRQGLNAKTAAASGKNLAYLEKQTKAMETSKNLANLRLGVKNTATSTMKQQDAEKLWKSLSTQLKKLNALFTKYEGKVIKEDLTKLKARASKIKEELATLEKRIPELTRKAGGMFSKDSRNGLGNYSTLTKNIKKLQTDADKLAASMEKAEATSEENYTKGKQLLDKAEKAQLKLVTRAETIKEAIPGSAAQQFITKKEESVLNKMFLPVYRRITAMEKNIDQTRDKIQGNEHAQLDEQAADFTSDESLAEHTGTGDGDYTGGGMLPAEGTMPGYASSEEAYAMHSTPLHGQGFADDASMVDGGALTAPVTPGYDATGYPMVGGMPTEGFAFGGGVGGFDEAPAVFEPAAETPMDPAGVMPGAPQFEGTTDWQADPNGIAPEGAYDAPLQPAEGGWIEDPTLTDGTTSDAWGTIPGEAGVADVAPADDAWGSKATGWGEDPMQSGVATGVTGYDEGY